MSDNGTQASDTTQAMCDLYLAGLLSASQLAAILDGE